MDRATIGDLEVSIIGIGCNNFGRALDAAGSKLVVDAAFDNGINFFDAASNYGNGQCESFLGSALTGRRDEAVIATKFGMPRPDEPHGGAAPDYVRSSVLRSLDDLQTDVIDLLQLHKPDPNTPIADTLGAMWELIDEGLVRQIGCSNLDAEQTREALAVSDAAGMPRFTSNQIHYSFIHREPETDGLADLALAEGVALLPYYPLGVGLLTGKVKRGETPAGRLKMDRYEHFLVEENFRLAELLVGFAASRGLAPVETALAWLLAQPSVPAVTPGARIPEQVVANAAAASVKLSADDLAELDRLAGV
jgi:aryl-alcohol dehydrogenase-like predicted oxidoreductase